MGSLRQIPTVGNKYIDVQKFFVQCLIILQLVSYSILGGKEIKNQFPFWARACLIPIRCWITLLEMSICDLNSIQKGKMVIYI